LRRSGTSAPTTCAENANPRTKATPRATNVGSPARSEAKMAAAVEKGYSAGRALAASASLCSDLGSPRAKGERQAQMRANEMKSGIAVIARNLKVSAPVACQMRMFCGLPKAVTELAAFATQTSATIIGANPLRHPRARWTMARGDREHDHVV
jgi:hypothetical protein